MAVLLLVALLPFRRASGQCLIPDMNQDPVIFVARIEYLFDDGSFNPGVPDGPPLQLGNGVGFSWDVTDERREPSIPDTATRRFECSGKAGGNQFTAVLTTATIAQARPVDPLYAGGAQTLAVDLYVRGPAGTPFTLDEITLGGSLFALRNPGGGTETNLHAYHNTTLWNGPGTFEIPPTMGCSTGVTTAEHPPGGPTDYTYATTLRRTVGGHAFHTGFCPFCPLTLFTYETNATIGWSVEIGTICCPQDSDLDNPEWGFGTTNKCYNYATNRSLSHPENPGDLSGLCLDIPTVMAAAVSDGLTPTPTDSCESGCLVALWVRPGCFFPEYHWARKNNDGTWSEKNAGQSAREIPPPDPAVVRGWNMRFAGYFCVPCGFQHPGAPPPPDPVPPDSVRVSPESRSGFRNPYFVTSDPSFVGLLRSAVVSGEAQAPAPSPERLGFVGFALEVGEGINDLPPFIEVRDGQILFMTESGLVARSDALGVSALLEETGIEDHGWACLIRARCPADMDCDGGVSSNDFFAFLELYFEGQADFDADGVTDSNDYFAYLTALFQACE